MAARKTIYVPDDILELAGEGQPLSTRIHSMLRRYRHLITEARPALTEAEWCTLCEACSGIGEELWGERPEGILTGMWANVADGDDIAARHGASGGGMVKRMRKWSPAQAASAYESVMAFWRHSDLPTDEAMKAAGMLVLE